MDNRDNVNDSTDARIERAKDSALGKHDSNPSHIDEASEAVGGISGVLAGAAIGSVAGPAGTIIGGIAGAMGGWWSGRAVVEAASTLTKNDDEYYRGDYESSPNRLADRSYEDVRPAYHLGHVAAHNPEYEKMTWPDVASDLQRGWSADHARKYGEWSSLSSYAGNGFMHGRSMLGTAPTKTIDAVERLDDKAAKVADQTKDRVAGTSAPKPGPDATDSAPRPDSRR